MRKAIALFLRIPASWAVGSVFLVPALETGLVFGFVLPGEVTVILGGVLAARGRAPLGAVLAASVAGPLVGDTIGYLLGRRYGEELVRRRLKGRYQRAHRWLSKRAAGAIFFGRFIPFVRTVLPTTAGAMRLRPGLFLPWDFAAAVAWGIGSTLLGYFAGRSAEGALHLGKQLSLGLGLIAAAAAALFLWSRRRRRAGVSSARRSPRAAS